MTMWIILSCCVVGIAVSGPVQDNFALINVNRRVYQLSLDGGKIWQYPGTSWSGALYDPVGKKIYSTDGMGLVRRNLDGSGPNMFHGTAGYVWAMSIDPASQLMYYIHLEDTAGTRCTVMAVTLDGEHVFRVTTDDAFDGHLCVDTKRGIIYYDESGKVMAAPIGGQHHKVFNFDCKIGALTTDPEGERIYVRCPGMIESVARDGSHRRVLIQTSGISGAMAFVGQNLYYADEYNNTNGLVMVNVSASTPSSTFVGPVPSWDRDMSMWYYSHVSVWVYSSAHHLPSIESNPCSHQNGGCDQICINTPSGCRCMNWDNFIMQNQTTCPIPESTTSSSNDNTTSSSNNNNTTTSNSNNTSTSSKTSVPVATVVSIVGGLLIAAHCPCYWHC